MSGHGHGDHGDHGATNKPIAMLIAVLALCLAFSETLGKSAQTDAISRNVEAANLWSFFQAKTIRQTTLRTAAEQANLAGPAAVPGGEAALKARTDEWAKTIARWESEPETGEGRRELVARAKVSEEKRDTSLARYHHYEIGSAAFQIGIVIASATLITGIVALAWFGVGLGIAGIVMTAIGFFAPHAVHLI